MTYRPFHTDHPSATENFAVLTYCAHGLSWVFVTHSKAIDNLRELLGFCSLSQRSEVFDGDAVPIEGISKNDDP